jgi:hypothetical protein
MRRTPVSVLLEVAAIGGRMGVAGDRLRLLLPPDVDRTLEDAIRTHKAALLALLRLTFVIVRSDALRDTVIFADSEETKTALVAAGADPGVVYSPDELRLLTSQRVSTKDLLAIHATKQTFSGKVVPEP